MCILSRKLKKEKNRKEQKEKKKKEKYFQTDLRWNISLNLDSGGLNRMVSRKLPHRNHGLCFRTNLIADNDIETSRNYNRNRV